ncbi:MAG TPA: hypothetical protein VFA59_11195 [Vicinamibacterales bacterium]|nr:hypothetical protein [Vicinamibacterales bacterium]
MGAVTPMLLATVISIPARPANRPTPVPFVVRTIATIQDEQPLDPTIAKALDLLRRFRAGAAACRTFRLVTPAEFDDQPEIETLRAFRLQRGSTIDPVIYIVRTNAVYRLAQRGDDRGVALLASTILHETVYGDRGDEQAAVRAEIGFLRHVVARGGPSGDSLMWQVRELEHRVRQSQLVALDALTAPRTDQR